MKPAGNETTFSLLFAHAIEAMNELMNKIMMFLFEVFSVPIILLLELIMAAHHSLETFLTFQLQQLLSPVSL